MIYENRYQTDDNYREFSNTWGVIDFLLSGNLVHISNIIDDYVNAASESDSKSRRAKMNNLWLPHYYSEELTKLNSRIFSSIDVKGIPLKNINDFTNTDIKFDSFFKTAIDSVINYGGVACAILPINGTNIIKLIEGKNIISVCRSELGTLEYIKWLNIEPQYDIKLREVTEKTVIYEYAVENNDIVLYVTKDDETVQLVTNQFGTELPIVGTQLRLNDRIQFRGTPFLASLAINTIRLTLNSTSLDFLLDTVLTPRLVHKGATPIKKLSSKTWRGVNIGPNDSLAYLEHSGSSLEAAKAQIERYKEDINAMTSALNPTSKQRTAFEVSMMDSSNRTIKDYLIDRIIFFLEKLFVLSSTHVHPGIKRATATYIEPVYETENDGDNKNGTISSNKQVKV